MKKNKNITKILAAALLAVLIAFSSGCSNQRDYGENFNLETDYQYSYDSNCEPWRMIQSDGKGQYIFKNQFIYYYNTEKGTMTPLCNKPNCLHDMETDSSRVHECNAYVNNSDNHIQYYDGYVYYLDSLVDGDITYNTLYRVKKDGSQKDKIFTTQNESYILAWMIHRGYLYYMPLEYYTSQEDSYDDDEIIQKGTLKALKLSSNMNEKNAKIVYDIGENNSLFNISFFKAYKDYFIYEIDVKPINAGENTSISYKFFLYNTKTGKNNEIHMPDGYGENAAINNVVFLEDKMLFTMYDESKDKEYKLPIYSINYDLTDEKIWLNDIEQGKWLQTYDNKAIITDADMHYDMVITEEGTGMDILKGEAITNVSIYSSDAKLISNFVYPMNQSGSFMGFGPDGMKLEFVEDDENWNIYILNIQDVLDCHGEKVKVDLISTRSFGVLNKEEI